MTNKDLSSTEHIIFFSQEELNHGYTYCNEIFKDLVSKFPGHTFIGIPDTIIIKDLKKEEIKEMIELLESYLDE